MRWGFDWDRRMKSGPGTSPGGTRRGVGRSSGLTTDCRIHGMESWRLAGGTKGCQSAGGFLMTEQTDSQG